MPETPAVHRLILVLGLCCLFAAGSTGVRAGAPAHGTAPEPTAGAAADEAEAAASGETGHGKAAEPQRPAFRLGPELKGFYDYRVLRARDRLEPYRYPLEGIVVQDSDGLRKQKIELGVVIEFGGESGMAELQSLEASVRQEIERLLRDIRFGELIHPEGKSRLKELIVRTVDRQLKTARVRQVYLTEFRVNL
ncbi:MAG TPA: flagellar basal body-associated FliL family protein [Candidatus Sumerlaeota bacterium]|nr:flagellar basal body-associated FliL family protein [Candidatus Sumerlaeota bacterium]HOR29195.1 flagellar basal body-associated FliL family protein [Candidatus Sumerlaeota bacterium]HPK02914.1 flagellar basal body-associated FliL family protein [Candidatus Sumerlaeota bacterium]